MEIKWIEDFISLARTGNFSKSASERNVTQPAFGRRIKSLERWLGAELIDRSTYPVTLTKEGMQFRETANTLLSELYRDKATFHNVKLAHKADIKISASTNLIINFIPKLLAELYIKISPFTVSIKTQIFNNMIQDLVDTDIDLVIQYYFKDIPLLMDTHLIQWLTLFKEPIKLYSTVDANGKAKFDLNDKSQAPFPLMAYSSDGYFSKIVTQIMSDTALDPAQFTHIVESPTAEYLLNISRNIPSIIWLPESAATKAIEEKKIIAIGNGQWDSEIEVRIFFGREAKSTLAAQIFNHIKQSKLVY